MVNNSSFAIKKRVFSSFMVFILFLPAGDIKAFASQLEPAFKEYSAGNIHGFINHLISKHEFYRAYVELKRLDSYYPEYLKPDNLFVTELYLLFKGKRYSEILAKTYDGSSLDTRAVYTIFKTDAYFDSLDFISAKALLDSTGYSSQNKDIDFYLYKRTILSYLMLQRIDEIRKIIIDPGNEDYTEYGFRNDEFTKLIEYSSSAYESFKKPCIAMTIGIIPGAGYAYSGQTATGIIAFILISTLSAITYYSFKTDNEPVGILFGAAATFFYGGSILGGYMAVKKYNDSIIKELGDSLSLKMNLADDREKIFNDYGAAGVGEK